MVRRLGVGLLLLALLLGTAVFLFGRDWRDWRSSPGWQATQSTTLDISPKAGTVRYTYLVNGEKFTGSRIRFFEYPLYNDGRDYAWIENNRRATEVTVYYNPKQPERAVLIQEVEQERVVMFVMTLTVLCGIVLLPLLFFGFIWRRLWQAFKP